MSMSMVSQTPSFESTAESRADSSDDSLDFVIPDANYLWSQIELAASQGLLELCEGLLSVYLNWDSHCNDNEQIKLFVEESFFEISNDEKNAKVSAFLQQLAANYESRIWYIYHMANNLGFDHVFNRDEIELKLLLSDQFGLDSNQIAEFVAVFRKKEALNPDRKESISSTSSSDLKSPDVKKGNLRDVDKNLAIDEKFLIQLRKLVIQKPKVAKLVIDLLNEKETESKKRNSLTFVYTQCLNHALINDKRDLTFDILSVLPDEEVSERNVILFEQVTEKYALNEEDCKQLYGFLVTRETPKLLQLISKLKRSLRKDHFYNYEAKQFHFKECFLMAAVDGKHFGKVLLEDDKAIYYLPDRIRLFCLIHRFYALEKYSEEFPRVEAALARTLVSPELAELAKNDTFLRALIKKLDPIFAITNWCAKQSNEDNSQLRFDLIRSLFNCESPLSVISRYHFASFERLDECDFAAYDEVLNLIQSYSEKEVFNF